MRQATEFPCCVHDGWSPTWKDVPGVHSDLTATPCTSIRSVVPLGDDGFPLVITRDNISAWFEWNEIPMPENSDGLSDAELILKFAEPLKAKSCFRVISYADALYFSRPDAIKTLKELDVEDWDRHGCFSHYPPELRKILREFALGQAYSDPVALLRQAIRERDEEIARKEAERKAKEEADRLAAEKAERERQEAYEKLKGFLESIGDFVILDDGVLTPIKDLLTKSDGDILLLGNRGREPFQLSPVNGFDENVQKIIKWMVENGAREPEPKSEAA